MRAGASHAPHSRNKVGAVGAVEQEKGEMEEEVLTRVTRGRSPRVSGTLRSRASTSKCMGPGRKRVPMTEMVVVVVVVVTTLKCSPLRT